MPPWLTDERVVLWIATSLYGVTAIVAALRLIFDKAWIQPTAYVMICIAFAVQLAGLSLRGKVVGGCPLGNPFEIIQFLTWSAVFLFLVTFPFVRLNLLGALVAGSTALLSGISLAVGSWDYTRTDLLFGGNPWIELHAALAMFSYGMLGVLALMSLMFLLQQFALKRKLTLPFFTLLPSVRELDVLGARLFVTGITLMSLALGVGFMFWFQNADSIAADKLVVTSIIWLAYLAIGLARWRGGLAAKRFAQISVLLYVCIILSIGPISGERADLQEPTAAPPSEAS